jgi:hypothetical protein
MQSCRKETAPVTVRVSRPLPRSTWSAMGMSSQTKKRLFGSLFVIAGGKRSRFRRFRSEPLIHLQNGRESPGWRGRSKNSKNQFLYCTWMFVSILLRAPASSRSLRSRLDPGAPLSLLPRFISALHLPAPANRLHYRPHAETTPSRRLQGRLEFTFACAAYNLVRMRNLTATVPAL